MYMLIGRLLLAIGLAVVLAVPLHAQRQGQVEIGVHARWAELDDRLGLDGGIGPGGRLGVFLWDWFAIEAEFEQIATERDVGTVAVPAGDYDYTPLYLRGSFNLPVAARSAIIAGLGYSRQDYDFEVRDAASGLLGFRLGVHRNVAIRVDGIADYAPSSEDWNYGARAGLSFMFGDDEPPPPVVLAADDPMRAQAADTANFPSRDSVVSARTPGFPPDSARAEPARPAEPAQPPAQPTQPPAQPAEPAEPPAQPAPAPTPVPSAPSPAVSPEPAPPPADTVRRPTPAPPDTTPMPMPPQLPRDSAAVPAAAATPDPADVGPVTERTAAMRSTLEERIHFGFDESHITFEAERLLEQKLIIFEANPELRIRVEGHTDSRGSDEYNQALGERRADAARRWLIERGVSADRIETVTFGEERPLCTQQTEACFDQNRRDQFVIIAGGDTLMPPR